MLIENMDDDHLLNTIKWQLKYHKGNYSYVQPQYMTEIKKRPALLAYEPVIEVEEDDDNVHECNPF